MSSVPSSSEYRFSFSPYPTGWFCVGWSEEVAVGESKCIKYFGKDLVLFRTESGRACVADAYCPHLGAHLGDGGLVEGETIRCPFHHWKYDADGQCVEVPFAKVAPPTAKLNMWNTVEQNGAILVWHDLKGRDPIWYTPEVDESDAFQGSFFNMDFDTLHTHPQEVLENGPDWAHFHAVHGTWKMVPEEGGMKFDGHTWKSKIKAVRPDNDDRAQEEFGGVIHHSWAVGPGTWGTSSVGERSFGFRTKHLFFGTPIDELTTQLRMRHFLVPDPDNTMSDDEMKAVSDYVKDESKRQLMQDAVIWRRKGYIENPILSSTDGPILKYREWYKQFYPENNIEIELGNLSEAAE